ncbi:ATP-binding protein [Cryobacterium psychrophilum]|uniref:histidine kinase n=1 Tax=Cryobacterium psychrophilum TaxID=41988 RepID=A0A4Y8KS72_9MICO|nr:ATP-binding protein [Cryobacterium psychrophilum]TDW30192.1 signal transduction histidine kinase [Cryobacterium psychrophilum]TFD77419.1 sensor histidine kinase [Cryobacterium psychrophilum]
MSRPPVLEGEPAQAGVVIAGVSLTPYRATQDRTLLAGLGLGLGVLVVAGVSALTAWVVRRALRPVAVMAQKASEWSEHDLSHRFDLGEPRDELTQLGQVFDALLARVSRAILAEQRLSAELAHELRTPLTVVRAESELATLDPHLPREQRARFERIIESADQVLTAATTGIRSDERTVTVAPSTGLELAVPQAVAVRALAPLIENALRFSRSAISVSAVECGDLVQIRVVDDGPGLGIDPSDLFSPGIRAANGPGPGVGLGLALARRLARAAGGDVDVRPGEPRTTFVLTLPSTRPVATRSR